MWLYGSYSRGRWCNSQAVEDDHVTPLLNEMSINRGWYMRNTLCPPRRPAQPSLRFLPRLRGNLNDEVRYTAQVHSHYHRAIPLYPHSGLGTAPYYFRVQPVFCKLSLFTFVCIPVSIRFPVPH